MRSKTPSRSTSLGHGTTVTPPCVLVIGDVMIDIIVKPEGPVERGTDTRAMIRRLPGGSGANQAAWLAHLGTTVVFVARVGSNDHTEQEILLRSYGVEPVLAKDERFPTGTLVTLVSSDGERSFLTDRGANLRLKRSDLPDSLLDRVGLVHVSGYALFDTGPRSAVLDFIEQAALRGIPVTVDPSSVSFLREVGPQAFLAWTKVARICFPNTEEAAILSGTSDPDKQSAILGTHYDIVVIKRGALGAEVTARGTQRWVVAAPPVNTVDTTGAGDAFLAGFLSAYLRGGSLPECLRHGVDAGSTGTTRLGGKPGGNSTGLAMKDPRATELSRLRAKIANNEIRGGSAFGRAVAEVIALTAGSHADADPDQVRSTVLEAARWAVQTKPSMTSVRAAARLAEETLQRQRGASGAELSCAIVHEMRAFIARSERAIASLAEGGDEIFRPGAVVLAHSFSESLVNVLRRAAARTPGLALLLTESRPLRESRLLAKALADTPATMTLYSDAGMAIAAAKADLAIVGADAILSDGSFANKTGTLPLALICRDFGIPLYVASELSKVHLESASDVAMEIRPAEELTPDWDLSQTGRVAVWNQFFELVPAEFVKAYITDRGLLTPQQVVEKARAVRTEAKG